ncbi:hypothetical protein ACIQOW_10965 [Kitasatospora sp. NPDC091335]
MVELIRSSHTIGGPSVTVFPRGIPPVYDHQVIEVSVGVANSAR